MEAINIIISKNQIVHVSLCSGVPEPESLIQAIGASPGLLSETLSVTEQQAGEEEKVSFLSVRN